MIYRISHLATAGELGQTAEYFVRHELCLIRRFLFSITVSIVYNITIDKCPVVDGHAFFLWICTRVCVFRHYSKTIEPVVVDYTYMLI